MRERVVALEQRERRTGQESREWEAIAGESPRRGGDLRVEVVRPSIE